MLRIRKAEKAIEESNKKFRTVADYAYDWEYWVDPLGSLLYISPSCERITGYSTNEFHENPKLLASIIYTEDILKVEAHKAKIIEDNECDYLEYRIITKMVIKDGLVMFAVWFLMKMVIILVYVLAIGK